MVVPHGSGSSRAVEVSQTFVKALLGIGSVLVLAFLVLGVAAISRGVNITHSRALENENRILADEIQRMRERMSGLRDTLHRFSEREQELRLLAGLVPTDTSVQQAGIGGPAGTWSERDSLKALGPSGQQALAARLDVDALARRANILVRSLNEAYDSLSKNRALMAAGLVDYVQVTLFPVITGQTGLDPIFQGAADFDLELVENRTLDGQIQELTYRPTLH